MEVFLKIARGRIFELSFPQPSQHTYDYLLRNFHPGKQELVYFKQDLGKRASPLVHINTRSFLHEPYIKGFNLL